MAVYAIISARETQEKRQKPCTWRNGHELISNGQISLADFRLPVEMNLKEGNRWVKKAQTIPWPEIEKWYAALFTNRKGNVAKPMRLALSACIIQAEYGYSDEETALQLQENPYLQYFCGME